MTRSFRARVLAMLVLLAVVATLPCVKVFAFSTGDSARPPACHSHLPVTPMRAPISLQCCMEGHHAAIPNAAFSPGPLAQLASRQPSYTFPDISFSMTAPSVSFPVASDSPPGAVPLRI